MTKLVGLCGKAGSGKDTAFLNFMLNRKGVRVKQLALATGVKQVCALIFRQPIRDFYDRKNEVSDSTGMTNRKKAQLVGTELGRLIDPNIWIRWMQPDFQQAIDNGYDYIVVTDVRFDNEAEWVWDNSGYVIAIVRHGDEALKGEEAAHASEKGVNFNLIDHTIHNTGTPKELGALLDDTADHLFRFGR